jgi:inosose dehydratase
MEFLAVTDGLPYTDEQGSEELGFRVGSAPDSWGVWFPNDPRQTPWTRFLDEIARAGYEWVELGPYGYLPTDAETLRSELERRGLALAGGTVGGPMHQREQLAAIQAQMLDVARLTRELGADHLVFLPAMYRDLLDGRQVEPAELDEDQWRALVDGANHLARVLREATGMRFVFHPHAESHVETDEQIHRFVADTDPELVGLCLDTGHVAYTHGDVPRLMREHADRIWYIHLKAVDPRVLAQVEAERLSFADAVKRDVMCEPGLGVPALDDVISGLQSLPRDTFVIVEQDLYPCDFDRPYPIAARTRKTLRTAGIG